MAIEDFIKGALSEDNGHPSAIRMNNFIAFAQWSVAITIGFLWVIGFYPYLIIEYLMVLATLIGGLVGLKVYQKKVENATTSEDPVVIGPSNNTATTEDKTKQ